MIRAVYAASDAVGGVVRAVARPLIWVAWNFAGRHVWAAAVDVYVRSESAETSRELIGSLGAKTLPEALVTMVYNAEKRRLLAIRGARS